MASTNANTNKPRRATKNKKNNKAKNKQERKWLRVLKSCVILLIFFTVVGLISAVIIFNNLKANTIEITDNNFWQNQSTALIYDSEGTQIGKLSEHVVEWTDICRDAKEDEEITAENSLPMCDSGQVAKVSPYYIDGLIATEDQGFMDHNGVNFQGMIRVTLSAIASGSTSGGGGSSITMQLAKLLYLGDVPMYDEDGNRVSWTENDTSVNSYQISYENKLQYKLSQMALAMKIEDKYSKQDIMENYVNTMWFGSGGYGIYNASEYFYGVTPDKLTLAQAATLAGITQRPNDWDPYTNPEGTTERRNVVLSRMAAEEYITEDQAAEAKKLDISADLVDHSGDSKEQETRFKYYNDINLFVLQELQNLLGSNADLNTGGMKIHTTIDPQLQEATIDTLDTANGLIGMDILDGTQTGTAMIDVETGGILALGNGFDGQTDYAYSWNEYHYPGSSAKPLVAYSPAIEYLGWSTAHIINDTTTYYTGGGEVHNYERNHIGNVTMMEALSKSLNTTAVQAMKAVEDEIGIDGMTAWFANVGLNLWKTADDAGENVYESYALGAFNSTPLEMASAFATFANGGTYNAPHVIDYIEFDEQSPYYEYYGEKWTPEYESHKAMEPSTAYLITMMLNPENDGAFTGNADIPELDLAIKTGTSNWPENPYGITEGSAKDRWTVGYSPDVATAVWYAYDSEHQKQGYEFYQQPEQPLYIFKALMENTINPDNSKLADGEFVMPDNVISYKDSSGVTQYAVKGSEDEKNKQVAPSAPYINVSLGTPNQVDVYWDASEGASEYNITVNGTVVETTSDTSASLSYDQLFAVGCESTYQIGLQAVSSDGLTSGTNEFPVNNDTSNCTQQDASTEEENTEEDASKEDTADEDTSKDEEDKSSEE